MARNTESTIVVMVRRPIGEIIILHVSKYYNMFIRRNIMLDIGYKKSGFFEYLEIWIIEIPLKY